VYSLIDTKSCPKAFAHENCSPFHFTAYHRVIFRGSVFPEIRKGTGRINFLMHGVLIPSSIIVVSVSSFSLSSVPPPATLPVLRERRHRRRHSTPRYIRPNDREGEFGNWSLRSNEGETNKHVSKPERRVRNFGASDTSMSYQYALDAADLLAQAERELLKLLSSCREDSSCDALADLLETLEYSRHHLLDHLDRILTLERHVLSPSATLGSTRDSTRPRTLSEAVHTLSSLLAANQARRKNDSTSTPSPRVSYFQTRSKDDTALFRLVVLLQLCMVRIDDARRGLAKKRSRTAALSLSSFGWWSMAEIATFAGLLSRVLAVPSFSRSRRESGLSIPPRLALLVVGTGSLSLTSRWMRRDLSVWWVSRKIHHSTHALDFWNQQWLEQRQLSIREDADIQQLVQDRVDHPSPTLSEKHPNARRLSKFQVRLFTLYTRSFHASFSFSDSHQFENLKSSPPSIFPKENCDISC
jgi:hypothetical protein